MVAARRLLETAVVVVVDVAAEWHCGECCNFHPLDLEEKKYQIKMTNLCKLVLRKKQDP